MKDARTEAAKEIEELKAKRAQEFQEMEMGGMGDSDMVTREMEKETEGRLVEARKLYEVSKDKVVRMLLETVLNVETQVHPNVLVAAEHQ